MSGSIPSWAVRGAKVVCVEGGSPNCDGMLMAGGYPVTGGTYTISSAYMSRYTGYALLALDELPDKSGSGSGWKLSRFRPLVTRSQEQDIEMFRKIGGTPNPALQLDGLPPNPYHRERA